MMATNDAPSLYLIRRCLHERKRANENLHNVTFATFKAGLKVQYKIAIPSGEREYFGSVVAVCGIPGTTRLRVRNLHTQKERDVELSQIIGIVQEN